MSGRKKDEERGAEGRKTEKKRKYTKMVAGGEGGVTAGGVG